VYSLVDIVSLAPRGSVMFKGCDKFVAISGLCVGLSAS
jgi:hypothetical protein